MKCGTHVISEIACSFNQIRWHNIPPIVWDIVKSRPCLMTLNVNGTFFSDDVRGEAEWCSRWHVNWQDVPQVCLQSIFVCFVQSNLTTQVLFLAFSSIKIASSLAQCWIENNWSVMLELYYHIKLQLVRFCRGSDSEEALKNQSDLATHLHHEGQACLNIF